MSHASQSASVTSASITLSKSDIIEFAQQFDPQPYHLDSDAAEQSIFGGLCASGWQVAAITTRLLEDALGREGLDVLYTAEVSSLKWKKPSFAGDDLELIIDLGASDSSSAPAGHYHQSANVKVINQNQEPVAEMATKILVRGGKKDADTQTTDTQTTDTQTSSAEGMST